MYCIQYTDNFRVFSILSRLMLAGHDQNILHYRTLISVTFLSFNHLLCFPYLQINDTSDEKSICNALPQWTVKDWRKYPIVIVINVAIFWAFVLWKWIGTFFWLSTHFSFCDSFVYSWHPVSISITLHSMLISFVFFICFKYLKKQKIEPCSHIIFLYMYSEYITLGRFYFNLRSTLFHFYWSRCIRAGIFHCCLFHFTML